MVKVTRNMAMVMFIITESMITFIMVWAGAEWLFGQFPYEMDLAIVSAVLVRVVVWYFIREQPWGSGPERKVEGSG
jgi:predicted benzoate:H+ symporter BenE